MIDPSHLKSIMHRILESDVVLGPNLANTGFLRMEDAAFKIIERDAFKFAASLFEPGKVVLEAYPGFEIPQSLVEDAITETIASTAAYLSHVRLGYLDVGEAMLLVSKRLIEEIIKEHGAKSVLTLILSIHAHDDYQLLHHYHKVLVSQFVSGELHRPFSHYLLQTELDFHVAMGAVTVHDEGGQQTVSLTEIGKKRYDGLRAFLKETGFFRRRAALSRLSQFGNLKNYDDIIETLTNIQDFRSEVLHQANIRPGMRVLELGCGTGEMTLTSGLYKLVGSEGEVIATEPSMGMLSRATRKLERTGTKNVRFIQAAAENLPFADNSFDAVVGCAFLHFTDIPLVLSEIARVAKPGALFTTIYALRFPETNPFFVEWFEPLLVRTMAQNAKQETMLPDSITVPREISRLPYDAVRITDFPAVTRYRYPEMTVKFVVEVANLFGDEMTELPFRAQQEMIDLLIRRGHDVLEKYGAEHLDQVHPGQFLQARIV